MSFASRKVFAIAALLGVLFPVAAAAQDNTIYRELLSQGVPLTNGKTAKLPTPLMADGLDSAAQQGVIKESGSAGKTGRVPRRQRECLLRAANAGERRSR